MNGGKTMTKTLAMLSGGLDSILAAKLIKQQGIEVIGICFESYFFDSKNAERMVKQIDIPLVVVDFSKEHMKMVKNPKHGHGKNMNPCIDCHAMMMTYTGRLLQEYNADFIITGEVLNQRPMSQTMNSLDIVKKESGFGDKILRPLCALNLPPTQMELDGLVQREKLLGIKGRNRKEQMELAKKWGIVDYPSPAGGCKLTEPNYSARLKDLLKYKENVVENDLSLLKIGRHLRLGDECKVISTRNEEEATEIQKYLSKQDTILYAADFSGSLTAIAGKYNDEQLIFAARTAARYSKGKDNEYVKVKYGNVNSLLDKFIEVKPALDEEINEYILN